MTAILQASVEATRGAAQVESESLLRSQRGDVSGTAATVDAAGLAWLMVRADAIALVLPLELQGGGSPGELDAALDPGQTVRGSRDADPSGGPELVLAQGAQMAGVVLTAGAVWWAIYGGTTLWILLAAGPLARTFDPLPVLARDPQGEGPQDAADDLFDATDADVAPASERPPSPLRASGAVVMPA